MDLNKLSPHVRRAIRSVLNAPFTINERIIFDYELIFVTGGQARIVIDGKTYIAKKNCAVFLPPGVHHRIEVDEGAFVQPHIHFDAIYDSFSERRRISFKSRADMSPDELQMIQEDVLREYGIPYVFVPSEMQTFQKYFFDVIDARGRKGNFQDLMCKAKLLILLQLILDQFCQGRISPPESNYCDAVKDYIDNNFDQTITLDDLERQFEINKFTMLRNFKKTFGCSIIAYYNGKRVEFAKKQLLSTMCPVTEIASRLSFPDIYSFSKFFKKHTGLSPSRYRDTHR